MIDPNIFSAYDIRGVYGENLTEEVIEKIGAELSELFPEKRFIIGNDTRASGECLAKALKKGLKTKANEVTYIGTAAFGATLHAGANLEKDVAIYLTASHLPGQWNGMKMFHGKGGAIAEDVI